VYDRIIATFRHHQLARVCKRCGAYVPDEAHDLTTHLEWHDLIDRLLELAAGD